MYKVTILKNKMLIRGQDVQWEQQAVPKSKCDQSKVRPFQRYVSLSKFFEKLGGESETVVENDTNANFDKLFTLAPRNW